MDLQKAKATFRGPMVSVATPFTADFKLDLETLRRNIRFMIDHGIKNGRGSLLVAAAGGEFPMLTLEERKKVVQVSVETAQGEVPVAFSIQTNWSEEAAELARHGSDVGADLGQLSAPYYYRSPPQDILRHFRCVVDNSQLPLMIYANWWNTGDFPLELIGKLAELPNVVVLKWSARSSQVYSDGMQMFADKLAIVDNDMQYLRSFMMGGVGYVTHIGNFWPAYSLSLWDLLESHDYAGLLERVAVLKRPWRRWVVKVVQETEGEGPFIKAALEAVGLPSGPPRPPASTVSGELRAEMQRLFAQAGMPQAKDQ